MLLGMAIKVTQGFSKEEEIPAANPTGIVFGMMVFMLVFVMVRSREREERREALRRHRVRDKRRSRLKKFSKLAGSSSSGTESNQVNEFRDDQMSCSER